LSALILLGSARSDGFTAAAASRLARQIGTGAELMDLLQLRIEPFCYGDAAGEDDFARLVDAVLAHEAIVFATPVYWYAMSGLMKNLFDRFTDLLGPGATAERGRALAGRETWLLSTGTDAAVPEGFEVPFERTSAYFGMVWRGACYVQVQPPQGLGAESFRAVEAFAARITAGPSGGA
jgi:multimeric flavodoxin WrbA